MQYAAWKNLVNLYKHHIIAYTGMWNGYIEYCSLKKNIIADKLTKINYFCLVFLLLINWISSAIEKVPKFGDKIITISESLLQSHSWYPYGQWTCNISPRNVSLIARQSYSHRQWFVEIR